MTSERHVEADCFRDYAEVLFAFALAISERTERSFSDAALEFTNLHRRLGFGRVDNGRPSPKWRAFAETLEACPTPGARLDWTVSTFVNAPSHASASLHFGCFSFELRDHDRIVRIHFNNRDSADDQGPLARPKVERRKAELREMFAHVRAHHPTATTVVGGSWLYNLEAYRRLFPPEYAASTYLPDRVRLDGTSSWGQLLDFRGDVKPAIRAALIANLSDLDVNAPWTAFPLRALGAECGIAAFYDSYVV